MIVKVVEGIALDNNVDVYTLDARTNKVLRKQSMHNRVVLAGRNLVRDALFTGGTFYPLKWFAIGTGSAVVADADVALANEIWRDLYTAKSSQPAQITLRYFLSPLLQNGQVIREAGLFTEANTMYARTVLQEDIVKTSAIAVLFVWTATMEAKT